MKDLFFKYKWKLVGVALGALAGFAYWYFIGCNSGTCPIQSNWESSTLYGALFGLVLAKGPAKAKEQKEKSRSTIVTNSSEEK